MPVEVDLPASVTYRTRHSLWDAYTTVREAGIARSPSIGMWMLAGYDAIHAVLADPGTFSSANTLPPEDLYPGPVREVLSVLPPRPTVLINDVGEEHRITKAVFNRGLTAERVKALRPLMKQRIGELIDDIGAEVDLRVLTQQYVATLVAALFGLPLREADQLQQWGADLQTLWNPRAGLEEQVQAARNVVAYHNYISDMLDENWHGQDLFTDVQEGLPRELGKPVRDKLTWMLMIAPIAATDTTRDTITSTVLALLDHRLWDTVRKDPQLTGKAVEETLRWLSPHCGLPRLVTRDVEVGGQRLSAGDQVLLLFGAANHDPAIYPQPETFDLHRAREHKHLSFGSGVRHCTGAPLARTEVRVALDELLARLPRPQLISAVESCDDWMFAPSPFFLGLDSLPLAAGLVLPATSHVA